MKIHPTLAELSRRLGGQVVGVDSSARIQNIYFDNREIYQGCLYVAIVGNNVDGHIFCKSALEAGAVACLVEKPIEGPHILVSNVVQSLSRLGKSYREEFKGPVVGVTGSAGKTTTKEMIASTLKPKGTVLSSSGNRNSEFTSPLVWLDRTESDWAAVIEMGMRGFGQIRHLASIAQPTIGVITNIGWAHIELVGGRDGIARAKRELFESLASGGTAVAWAEDEYLKVLRADHKAPIKTFGFSDHADSRITSFEVVGQGMRLRGLVGDKEWEYDFPFGGRAMALNVAAALLVADLAGVDLEKCLGAVSQTVFPPLRNQWADLNGAKVLIDAYNSNPASLALAIEHLASIECTGLRHAVLGTMRELGPWAETGHRYAGQALHRYGIDRVCLFGPDTQWIGQEAVRLGLPADSVTHAKSLEDVTDYLRTVGEGDLVLVKGSRAVELEKSLRPFGIGVRT